MYALSHFGLLSVHGKDPGAFLQGQFTCDMRTLGTHLQLGGYCNLQGRLMAVFYCFQSSLDTIGIILPSAILPSIQTLLQKYGRFSRMTCTSDPRPIWGCGVSDAIIGSYPLAHDPQRCIAIGEPPMGDLAPNAAWIATDITQQIPWILTPEMQGLHLPHHVGLPALGGVSFDKGCYLGQEIVARMHYRAKNVRNQNVVLHGEGPVPITGDRIVDINQNPVGQVLYAAATEGRAFIALGVMTTETASALSVEGSGTTITRA